MYNHADSDVDTTAADALTDMCYVLERDFEFYTRGTGGQCDFFFFQAEDGIRDVAVTGVQTCALPICAHVAGVVCDDDGRPRENRGAFLKARAGPPAAVLLDGVRVCTGGHARVALADSEKRALGVPRRDFLGGRHYAALGALHDLDSLLDRLREELPDGRAGPQEKHPRGHPLHREPRPRRIPARRIRLSRGGRHSGPRARGRCPLLSALGTSPRGGIR